MCVCVWGGDLLCSFQRRGVLLSSIIVGQGSPVVSIGDDWWLFRLILFSIPFCSLSLGEGSIQTEILPHKSC